MAIRIKNPERGTLIDKFVRKNIKYVHPVGAIRDYKDEDVAKDILNTYTFLRVANKEDIEEDNKKNKSPRNVLTSPSKVPFINHAKINKSNLNLRLQAGEYNERGLLGKGVEADLTV